MAPSTVIELKVDKLSQKSFDSATSPTITSGPLEVEEDRGQTSITVSNILARTEDEEQKAVIEGECSKGPSNVEKEIEAALIQKTNTEGKTEDFKNENKVTEKSNDDETTESNQSVTADIKTEEVKGDSALPPGDDAQIHDERSVEDTKRESSVSATEDVLNEKVPERVAMPHQMSPEPEVSLDNSVVGGTSAFNEGLADVPSVGDQVHPSDLDDSQESSYISAATGEEGEVVKNEQDKHHDDDEGESNDRQEQESRMENETEMQDVELNENEESKSEEKPVSCLDSQVPQAETPEENITESPKEKVSDHQSSSKTEGAFEDTQSSDAPTPSSVQDAVAASDSTSLNQPTETSGNSEGKTPAGASDDVTTTVPNSDTPKKTDSVSKTKEIKIARLDVSNVALDTERLELKETCTTVRIYFLFPDRKCPFSQAHSILRLLLVYICRKQSKAKHQWYQQQQEKLEALQTNLERAAHQLLAPPCSVFQSSVGLKCINAS